MVVPLDADGLLVILRDIMPEGLAPVLMRPAGTLPTLVVDHRDEPIDDGVEFREEPSAITTVSSSGHLRPQHVAHGVLWVKEELFIFVASRLGLWCVWVVVLLLKINERTMPLVILERAKRRVVAWMGTFGPARRR